MSLKDLEARVGIEPTFRGFADLYSNLDLRADISGQGYQRAIGDEMRYVVSYADSEVCTYLQRLAEPPGSCKLL